MGRYFECLEPRDIDGEVAQLTTALALSLVVSTPSPPSEPEPEGEEADKPSAPGIEEPAPIVAGPIDPPGHVYAIWRHPLRPDLRGLLVGWLGAWRVFVRTLPNGFYSYRTGTRLRRFESFVEARAAYVAEAARHQAPVPPRVLL